MVSVLNTDTMTVSRKDLTFEIVNILDLYFKDNRAHDFTLFFWPKKKENGNIQIDIKFNWRISELNEFLVSSSAFSLFSEAFFEFPFMGFDTNKELSRFIDEKIGSFEISSDEFTPIFSIVNGTTLHKTSWNSTMRDLLGQSLVNEYYATQRFDKLSSLLTEKGLSEKLIKI